MNEKSNGKADDRSNDRTRVLVIMYLAGGGLKILGKVADKKHVVAGAAVDLTDVWQITQMMAPTPDGGGMSQMTMLMPLPGARSMVNKLTVVPEVWMFPDEAGLMDHMKDLLKDINAAAIADRAQKAGIITGQPGVPPGIGQIKVPPR